MAIVNGPLFSLDASGQVGKALVYTKWKGRNVVREYVTPANPNTFAQRAQRAFVAATNLVWQQASSTDKESWLDLANANNYSTFNGMMSYNLEEFQDNVSPTENRSTTPVAPTATISGVTGTGGSNSMEVDVSITSPAAGEYAMIQIIEGGTSPGNNFAYAVAVVPMDDTTKIVELTDIPAGTYSISAIPFTATGGRSSPQSDTSIVVTGI